MADEDNDAPQPEQNAQDQQPQIRLNVQYIKDLSFEAPNAPEVFLKQNQQPQISVGVDIDARRIEGAVFEVVLKLNVEAKRDDEPVFIIELAYGTVCTLMNFPQEQMEAPLLIEVPRMAFPFARRVIADVTQDGGFPPLMLDPIDFVRLYQQNKANQRAGEEAAQQKPN